MNTCPNCKQTVEEGIKFCAHCGFLLEAAETAHPGATLGNAAVDSAGIGARASGSYLKVTPQERGGERTNERGGKRLEKVLEQPAFSAGRLVLAARVIDLPFQPGVAELLIGRADPVSGVYPEIDLTGHGGDIGGVSRRHARLVLREGEVFLEDLNSTNFTFLNRQRLQPGQLYPVRDGDEIRLGNLVLVYHTS